ncbi:uncharacterized protein LOC127861092 [Dreissena polymorpha]|uniref:Ig-like domain-containing protein n=1 Tax=Dreissena polymorpha TaxID=45954 RepID=A0A9D4BR38_DREPO|nr:uncharacterized protein LOC127861092 [Dreissena polymorpha]KAH3704493.1 hypothetical protein DPMN_079549 [Dreissena polymorpha]
MGCTVEKIVGLFLLLGQQQLTGADKVYSNSCGHIKIENPDLLFSGRNVIIHFLPNQTFNQFNVKPEIYYFGNVALVYKLLPPDNETNAYKFELINYPANLPFYIEYGRCTTETVQLNLEELTDCGHLYMRTPCVLVGSQAELVFIPAPAVVGFNKGYVLYWLETRPASTERRIFPGTGKLYKQQNESDSTYVLIISNTHKAMDGNTYRVQCTYNTSRNTYTDPITMNVFQKPDAPALGPLHDFDNCKGCLLLESNNTSREIYCKTSKTDRTNVSIELNGQPYQNIKHTDEMYIPIVKMVTDKDHLTNVTCSVINCAIKEPLVASAQLYVAKNPGKLHLNVPVIYKGMEPNITCTIKGGRPKSNLTFHMYSHSDVISSTQIDTFDNESRTYESTATATSVTSNSWNGKEIMCLQKQPYNLSEFVSEMKTTVRYMYPPSELLIQLDKSSFSKKKDSYIIDVSCNSTETNMPCTITWSPTQDELVYLKPPTNVSKGSFITYTAQLNATRQMNGRTITCAMHCAPFESKSVSEVLYIPFTPMVLINSSQVTPRKDGSSYSITCYADSYPPPNITWRYTQDGTEHTESCNKVIKCPVLVSGLLQGEKRNYVCIVEHMFGTLNASVIADGEESAMVSKENRPSSTILVVSIVVSCLFLAGLVIGIVMCIKRKRRNTSSIPSRRNGDPSTNDLQDKNRESSVEYAVVSKSRNKQTPTQSTTEIHPSQSNECAEGQLVYVELDTELLEARSTSGSKVRSRQEDTTRQEETIEYVDIDFAKKSEPPADDNIYANQVS